MFLQGAPIMWRSQTQKTVSLSRSEAEYYELLEAAKEIKFVVQVLEPIGLDLKKPIVVHIDNVGAIFIAESPSATKHTRHIDACYHFIREYIIDGKITIIFVTSQENKADMFTKNATSDVFDCHANQFISEHHIVSTTTEELNKYKLFDYRRVFGSDPGIESHNGIKKKELGSNRAIGSITGKPTKEYTSVIQVSIIRIVTTTETDNQVMLTTRKVLSLRKRRTHQSPK
jgi:hypothetical protein